MVNTRYHADQMVREAEFLGASMRRPCTPGSLGCCLSYSDSRIAWMIRCENAWQRNKVSRH